MDHRSCGVTGSARKNSVQNVNIQPWNTTKRVGRGSASHVVKIKSVGGLLNEEKRYGYYLAGLAFFVIMGLGLLIGKRRRTRPSSPVLTPQATQDQSREELRGDQSSTNVASFQHGDHHSHEKTPFSVAVRDISLYILWERNSTPPNAFLTQPTTITTGMARIGVWLPGHIGLWQATHLIWQPTILGQAPPLIEAQEAKCAAAKLVSLSTSDVVRGNASVKPSYLILHIKEVYTPRPLRYHFSSEKAKAAIERSIIDVQESFVEDLQRQWELGHSHVHNEWQPSKVSHYDRETQRRGWIVLSPTHALVVGVNDEQVRILASLIQPRDTSVLQGNMGIGSERYQDVLGRVVQWNSTQDSFEAVAHLESLITSGRKSTDGQVLLNLALAFIGILIAAFTSSTVAGLHTIQIVSLILLIVASVLFGLYARSGRFLYQTLGWFLSIAALLLAFASSWFSTLFNAIIRFHW
jgi:hypothetical protein